MSSNAPKVNNDFSFVCYAVYERPSDYPNSFVVRKWVNGEPNETAMLADDLVAARRLLPAGLVRIPHQNGEDKTIVETWL